MTSWSGRKEGRRPWYRLTIRSAQAIIAGVGLTLGVLVTAFRFSEWARHYEYEMLSHAIAEGRALKAASQQAQVARTDREFARLIARDSRLDGERYAYAWSPSLAKKHPRLEAAWRRTLALAEAEREDVLLQLEDDARALIRGSEYAREQSAYHSRVKLKYQQATFYPWMPLEPDPPFPVPFYPFKQ